jgi:hypothetical protein
MKERSAVSSLDTVFLFTFSIIVFLFTLLNIYVGTLGGFLPLLVITVCMYPLFIGVYRGIMRDDLCERLAGWHFLFILVGLVAFLMGVNAIMVIVAVITRFPYLTEHKPWSDSVLFLVFVSIVIVFVLMILWTAWNELLNTYSNRLPSREEEIRNRGRAFWRHAFWGSTFSATVFVFTVLTFTVVFNNANLVVGMNPDPGSLVVQFIMWWFVSIGLMWVNAH